VTPSVTAAGDTNLSDATAAPSPSNEQIILDVTPSKGMPPPQKMHLVSLRPWPSTSDFEHLLSNSHSHDECLCQPVYYTWRDITSRGTCVNGKRTNKRTDGQTDKLTTS